MFLSGLDDIDRRLVELLIHNARMSYSDLGQAVGLSRVAVKARVRALEERGVIEEYTTIVNPQKISGAVSCYFELEVEPAQFSAVVDTLRASDTVTQIYQVSGRNKLHVHAVAAGQGELEDFLDRVIHRCQPELQHHPLPHQGHQGPAPVRKIVHFPPKCAILWI